MCSATASPSPTKPKRRRRPARRSSRKSSMSCPCRDQCKRPISRIPAGHEVSCLHLSFCGLADSFSLTPCFSWGLGDVLTRQPFQRLSADGKPLKAVARLRPPSSTLLKQGVNERAVNTAVRQRWLLAQKLRCAQLGRWSDSCYFIHHFAFA